MMKRILIMGILGLGLVLGGAWSIGHQSRQAEHGSVRNTQQLQLAEHGSVRTSHTLQLAEHGSVRNMQAPAM